MTSASPLFITCARATIGFDEALENWKTWWTALSGRGALELVPLDISLQDVEIYSLDGEHIASVARATTRLDAAQLFAGRGIDNLIPRVKLEQARLTVIRRSDGTWNLQRVIQRDPTRPPLRLKSEIECRSLSVTFIDSAVTTLGGPQRQDFQGAARLVLQGQGDFDYAVRGRILSTGSREPEDVAARGNYALDGGPSNLHVSYGTPRAEYWVRYLLPRVLHKHIAAGSARGTALIALDRGSRPRVLRARARLWSAHLRHEKIGLPMEAGDFTLLVGPRRGRFTGTGSLGPATVEASGSFVTGDGAAARIRVRSETMDLDTAFRLMPQLKRPQGLAAAEAIQVAGRIELDRAGWRAVGDVKSDWVRMGGILTEFPQASFEVEARGQPPQIQGTVRAPRASSGSLALTHPAGWFRWDGAVLYSEVSSEALGGTAEARSWITPGESAPDLRVRGRLRGTAISELLPPTENRRLTGWADAEFEVSGSTETPRVVAWVDASPLGLNGLDLGRVTGRVLYEDNRLEIQEARLTRGNLDLLAQGSIQTGESPNLNVQVFCKKTALSNVLTAQVGGVQQGMLEFQGLLTGSTDAPRLEGRARLTDLLLSRPGGGVLAVESIEADAAWAGREVRLSSLASRIPPVRIECRELTLTPGPAEEASGPSWAPGKVQIAGFLQILDLRLPYLYSEFLQPGSAPPPLSGKAERLTLELGGTLSDPRIRAEAAFESVHLAGLDLGIVEVRGQLFGAEGRVALTSLEQRSATLRTTASGEFHLGAPAASGPPAPARVALRYETGGLDLAALLRRYVPGLQEYAELEVELVRAHGEISGTIAAPRLEAQVELSALSLNGRRIPVRPFSLSVGTGIAVARGLAAELAGGSLHSDYIALLLDPEERDPEMLQGIAASFRFQAVPIGVVQQLVEDSPWYISGHARALRELLEAWSSPISGELDAEIVLPLRASPAGRLEDILDELRACAPTNVRASLLVAELRSPPGPDSAAYRLEARANYDSQRVALETLQVSQAPELAVQLSGEWRPAQKDFAGRLQAGFEARGLDIEALSRLPIRGLRSAVRTIQPIGGALRFNGTVEGDPGKPRVSVALDVERPTLMGVRFGSLSGRNLVVDLAVRVVTLGELHLERRFEGDVEPDLVRVSGTLPLQPGAFAVDERRPRDIRVVVPNRSLRLLSELAAEAGRSPLDGTARSARDAVISLLRQVAGTAGRLDADVRLGGSISQPDDSGYVRIVDAGFAADGLSTRLEKASLEARLAGDEVNLTLAAAGSNGGRVTGGGSIRLGVMDASGNRAPPVLDLWLELNRLRVEEKQLSQALGPAYTGTQFVGTLQSVDPATRATDARLRLTGPANLPRLAGAVRVDAATLTPVYTAELAVPAEGLALPLALDLKLVTGASFVLRNTMARLELRGEVSVQGEWAVPLINGRLDVTRGAIQLPGLRLRNVEGAILLAHDPRAQVLRLAVASPVTVDLLAESTIRLARGPGHETETYDLEFHIAGSPGGSGSPGIRPEGPGGGLLIGDNLGLSVTVRSDPPLPPREIEALIRQHYGVEGIQGGGSNVVETLRGQLEQAFAANVSSAFTGRLEDVLESALGIGVSIDVAGTDAFRIRLSRQLFGRLQGAISHSLGGDRSISQTRYELFYRLTPRLRIGYRQEEPLGLRVIYVSGGTSF